MSSTVDCCESSKWRHTSWPAHGTTWSPRISLDQSVIAPPGRPHWSSAAAVGRSKLFTCAVHRPWLSNHRSAQLRPCFTGLDRYCFLKRSAVGAPPPEQRTDWRRPLAPEMRLDRSESEFSHWWMASRLWSCWVQKSVLQVHLTFCGINGTVLRFFAVCPFSAIRVASIVRFRSWLAIFLNLMEASTNLDSCGSISALRW